MQQVKIVDLYNSLEQNFYWQHTDSYKDAHCPVGYTCILRLCLFSYNGTSGMYAHFTYKATNIHTPALTCYYLNTFSYTSLYLLYLRIRLYMCTYRTHIHLFPYRARINVNWNSVRKGKSIYRNL